MTENTTTIGFEDKLWLAADKLRGSMDAAEYKHVVLGLIFLKYVSDSFSEKYNALVEEGEGFEEDKDEYMAENIFWVPLEARWSEIAAYAMSTEIGKKIDTAMELIEKENPSLKGILSKNYSRQELDKTRLGELVTLFTNIEIGSDMAKERDMLGRVYEYFLSKFASAEGKLEGIIALSAKTVKNHQLINLEHANRVDYDLYNKWMPVKLQYEDILMTSEAPLGEFFYMGEKSDYCLSQRLFAIRANKDIIQSTYLYKELSGIRGLNQIISRSTGSTVVGIKQAELRKVKIVIPQMQLQIKYHEIASNIQNKIQNNADENQKLNSVRDTLLPKLMSGEIDVSNIEIND